MTMTRMMNKMFGRRPSKAMAARLSAKFRQPLLMHPEYGRDLVESYIDADQFFDLLFSDMDKKDYVVNGSVAVLDIAGALIAREEEGFFSFGMTSYEGLRNDLSDLLADESIDTIVARIDSPGGMASQNIDLSDFIYANRGRGTKLVAMVDDMAYSAAFAIASAFDEIWVTRTGGVGSVGVVSYHVDQSQFDKRIGVKVEYIYAGDKKVMGNPHAPLDDATRAEYQKEVDRLYNLFTATVSRNLGMSVEDVVATQAGTYHGEEALAVGFATHLGTFDELMSQLLEDDEDEPMNPNTDAQQAATDVAVQTTQEQVADTIIDMATEALETDSAEADAPEADADAAQQVDEPAAEAEQDAQADEQRAAGIRAICASAGKPEAADDYIQSGMELSEVRETLLALTSTSDSTTITSASAEPTSDKKPDHGWSEAFAKAQKL